MCGEKCPQTCYSCSLYGLHVTVLQLNCVLKTAADENSSWPTQHRSGGPGATAQLPPTSRPIVPRGAPRHAQFYALRRARLALQQPHQHVDQHAQEQKWCKRSKRFLHSQTCAPAGIYSGCFDIFTRRPRALPCTPNGEYSTFYSAFCYFLHLCNLPPFLLTSAFTAATRTTRPRAATRTRLRGA